MLAKIVQNIRILLRTFECAKASLFEYFVRTRTLLCPFENLKATRSWVADFEAGIGRLLNRDLVIFTLCVAYRTKALGCCEQAKPLTGVNNGYVVNHERWD